MSPAEAQKRQKNLPKGYAYEPIFIPNQPNNNNNTSPSSETPSSSKRERKKKKENPEFVDPTSVRILFVKVLNLIYFFLIARTRRFWRSNNNYNKYRDTSK